MSTEMQTKVQASPVQSFTPAQTGLLQRKSALCNTPGLLEDSGRDQEKLTLLRSSAAQAGTTTVPRFGHDFSRVSVHSTGLGMIQTKLTINEPGDPYEQEADRVADAVMRMRENAAVSEQVSVVRTNSASFMQRQTIDETLDEEEQEELTPILESVPTRDADELGEEEELDPILESVPARDTGELGEEEELTPFLESVPTRDTDEFGEEEEEELIQPKSNTGAAPQVTPGIAHDIHSLKGTGQPLPTSERTFFEPRFGRDFSNVRVHTNERAAHASQSINAQAFTLGRDVVFGAGQFSPGTHSGRKLIAHELAHVVQQQGETATTVRRTVRRRKHSLEELFEKHPAKSEIKVKTRWQDLNENDIKIAKRFNTKHYQFKRSIGAIVTLAVGGDVRVFNKAVILRIARYQQRHHLRVDGQVGWYTLRHMASRLIGNKADYSGISDAIWLVVDGLGLNVAKVKSIVYDPKQNANVKVLNDGVSIRMGTQALRSYNTFVNALKRGLGLVNGASKGSRSTPAMSSYAYVMQLDQFDNYPLETLYEEEPEVVSIPTRDKTELSKEEKLLPISEETLLDVLHYALDGAGMIPALGVIPDAANATIYLIEGNWTNAGISALAMIPIFGQGVTVTKWGVKVSAKAVKRVGRKGIERGLKKAAKKEAAKKAAKEKAAKEAAEKATKGKTAKGKGKKGKEKKKGKKGKWGCQDVRHNVYPDPTQNPPKTDCPERVIGWTPYIHHSFDAACKAAKIVANSQVLKGCIKRHGNCRTKCSRK